MHVKAFAGLPMVFPMAWAAVRPARMIIITRRQRGGRRGP